MQLVFRINVNILQVTIKFLSDALNPLSAILDVFVGDYYTSDNPSQFM